MPPSVEVVRTDFRVRFAIHAWRAVQRYPRLSGVLKRPRRIASTFARGRASAVTSVSTRDWPFTARDRSGASGSILVIDDKVPEFDQHAGGLFMFQLLQILRNTGMKVLFLPDDSYPRQPYTKALQRAGVEVLHGHFDLDSWLRTNGPYLDWVMAARPHVAPNYISRIRTFSKARLIYYTVDLHFLRERRRYESTGDLSALKESERLKAIEAFIAQTADCVVSPSTDEISEIQALAPGKESYAIPPYFLPAPRTGMRPPLGGRSEVLFVAGFNHHPNVDAANVLVQEVMPLVWQALPDVKVLLVGSHPTPEVQALASDRVSVTGYVPQLGPYYDRARMTVSPLRFGAGLKGKILSSIQFGAPVVTTAVGNEGIELVDGVHALLGEAVDELAAHVIRLFSEPELGESLSAAAHEFLVERFGPDRTRDQLFKALGVPVTLVSSAGTRSTG